MLSGGLDSAVCLAIAKKKGYTPIALTVDYGQRHKRELASARRLAKAAGLKECVVVKLPLEWSGSSLLAGSKRAPDTRGRGLREASIPSTYVPARNSIFLALAASLAEARGAKTIFIGVNDVDFSGYTDCRPAFIKAMNGAIREGTRPGSDIRIVAPLLGKDKAGIIKLGGKLGVDFGLSWSCYFGGKRPCGKCDSCRLRAKGFKEAGIIDPLTRSVSRVPCPVSRGARSKGGGR